MRRTGVRARTVGPSTEASRKFISSESSDKQALVKKRGRPRTKQDIPKESTSQDNIPLTLIPKAPLPRSPKDVPLNTRPSSRLTISEAQGKSSTASREVGQRHPTLADAINAGGARAASSPLTSMGAIRSHSRAVVPASVEPRREGKAKRGCPPGIKTKDLPAHKALVAAANNRRAPPHPPPVEPLTSSAAELTMVPFRGNPQMAREVMSLRENPEMDREVMSLRSDREMGREGASHSNRAMVRKVVSLEETVERQAAEIAELRNIQTQSNLRLCRYERDQALLLARVEEFMAIARNPNDTIMAPQRAPAGIGYRAMSPPNSESGHRRAHRDAVPERAVVYTAPRLARSPSASETAPDLSQHSQLQYPADEWESMSLSTSSRRSLKRQRDDTDDDAQFHDLHPVWKVKTHHREPTPHELEEWQQQQQQQQELEDWPQRKQYYKRPNTASSHVRTSISHSGPRSASAVSFTYTQPVEISSDEDEQAVGFNDL